MSGQDTSSQYIVEFSIPYRICNVQNQRYISMVCLFKCNPVGIKLVKFRKLQQSGDHYRIDD